MKKFISSNLCFLLVLVFLVIIVYVKAVNFGLLTLDDTSSITEKLDVISSMKNIPTIFTSNCYNEQNSTIPYYRPILVLSFSLETILFGYNEKVYHFDNIVLFVISLCIMFLLLIKLKLNENISKVFLILLSVHPVLASNVVYVSTRAEILITIFILLSFIFLIDFLNTKKMSFLFLYVLCYTIALFTKETTLMTVPIYFLFVFMFGYKISVKDVFKLLLPLIVVSLVYFVFRSNAIVQTDLLEYITNMGVFFNNFIKAIILYTDKIVLPNDLSVILYNIKVSFKEIVVFIISVLVLVFAYIKFVNLRKTILFCLICFVLFLFPTVFITEYQFFFHRLLLPMFFLVVIGIQIVDGIVKEHKNIKKVLLFLSVVVLVIFSCKSFIQADKYINSDIFWLNAYKDAPNYHLCCSGLGKQCIYAKNYDKAIEFLFEAKKLKNLYEYDLDICTALIAKGDIDKAKERLLKMTKIQDEFTTLRYLSEIYYIQGDFKNSKIYAEKALKISPNDKMILRHYKRLNDIYKNM